MIKIVNIHGVKFDCAVLFNSQTTNRVTLGSVTVLSTTVFLMSVYNSAIKPFSHLNSGTTSGESGPVTIQKCLLTHVAHNRRL